MSNRRVAVLILVAVLVVVLALGLAFALSQRQAPQTVSVVTTPSAAATPIQCRSSNGLPDPICTPGFADPRVTQANIKTTICVSGYTTRIRPPTTYTNALKRQQIAQYGYTDTNLADYEEDHLIPLELGGHPTDAKNLWPEPRSGIDGASKKDVVENSLHARVCAGLITLATAQAAIARNWESA